MQCVEENPEETHKLISGSEMDSESEKHTQRQTQSSCLLNKELESIVDKPYGYLIKVSILLLFFSRFTSYYMQLII